MAIESWFPIGFELPDGASCGTALYGDENWQIIETRGGGRVFVASAEIAGKWIDAGIVSEGELKRFSFGSDIFHEISCDADRMLAPLAGCRSPSSLGEAMAFALALRSTRKIDPLIPLQDAVYIETISRLLPIYGNAPRTEDDMVLGYWLTGGARVSAKSFRRLRQMLSWIEPKHLHEVVIAAGVVVDDLVPMDSCPETPSSPEQLAGKSEDLELLPDARKSPGGIECVPFELPGRPALADFFNEHVVDIILHKERYKALGVGFPAAVILHGPPGCGKTFAVEQLVEFLGWPSFQIDASSVASPYIHETSKKVADVFEKAMKSAPSVLVIDEMEAFLADRETGGSGSHHRVEEVAEFLRRIPEASKNEVLIIAMTNRIDMIDAAIMRRGRFDHVIKVDYANAEEVSFLLDKLLETIPKDTTVNSARLADRLAGRPLSDVAFVVREGARLAAKAGERKLGQEFLLAALEDTPARTPESTSRPIGFI